jgi:hypothetical protein
MDEVKNPQPPGHPTLKDSVACTAVRATMLLTMACGAFVVDAGTDAAPRYAQTLTETSHD